MKTHKDLEVWKDSMDLVEEVYIVTKRYPKEEVYSLVSQMRRASISVPSNISEGAARHSQREFLQFIYVGLGSLTELETQILLSKRLGFIGEDRHICDSVEKVRAKLLGLIKAVKAKI